jgi:hypothetical protein
MNNDQETVLAALLTHLAGAVTVNFTGNGSSGSAIVSNLSATAGFFIGLPVFGPGVPRGAVIQSFDAIALTATLDQPLTEDSTGGSFTTGFLTTSRRLKFWSEVEEQPALFVTHTGAEDEWSNDVFAKTTVEADIVIYSRAGEDPDAAPDITLNNLVNAVREALAPDDPATGTFTLGDLCHWCRIEGKTEYDPGDTDKQSKAVIAVRILLP